jgi:hypothetical protein
MFYNATQDVTNPITLLSVCCIWNIPFLHDAMLYYLISHMISQTDLLQHHLYELLRYFYSTFRYHSFATRVSQLKI